MGKGVVEVVDEEEKKAKDGQKTGTSANVLLEPPIKTYKTILGKEGKIDRGKKAYETAAMLESRFQEHLAAG